jgi:hypothetical protein
MGQDERAQTIALFYRDNPMQYKPIDDSYAHVSTYSRGVVAAVLRKHNGL